MTYQHGLRMMVAAALMTAAPAVWAGQAPQSYGDVLSTVYEAYQRIIAVKDACSETFKESAAANNTAYVDWRTRHKAFVDELEARFDGLIRGVSKDEQDYTRNYGKYRGAVLLEQREHKRWLQSQPREDVQRLCQDLPAYLKGPESDLGAIFAQEMQVMRAQRPLKPAAAAPAGK